MSQVLSAKVKAIREAAPGWARESKERKRQATIDIGPVADLRGNYGSGGIADESDPSQYCLRDLRNVANDLIRRARPDEAALLVHLFGEWAEKATQRKERKRQTTIDIDDDELRVRAKNAYSRRFPDGLQPGGAYVIEEQDGRLFVEVTNVNGRLGLYRVRPGGRLTWV